LEHLGDIHAQLNNLVRAREFWQKALQFDTGNARIEKKLATP